VRLHDRRHARQVPVRLAGGGGAGDGGLQSGQQVSDHGVVLLQRVQGVAQLGVLRGDGREQVPVLALVVGGFTGGLHRRAGSRPGVEVRPPRGCGPPPGTVSGPHPAAGTRGGAMRFDDGLPIEDLVTAVRRAAARAAIADADTGRDMRITALELTLHVVAKREAGAKLEFRIPVLGMPVSFGTRLTTRHTHQIKITLEPPERVFEVRGGDDVEDTLVQAIETVRAVVARGLGDRDAFRLRSSEVELTFAVTGTGTIALVGTADLTDEVTHTLKLTLGPA
jgi:hypothetical protein